MAVILQVDFPSQGPFGEAMSQAYQTLAESINQETGMIWKIWTENAATLRAGGWYAFSDYESLEAYKEMHCARLTSFGITDIETKIFTLQAHAAPEQLDNLRAFRPADVHQAHGADTPTAPTFGKFFRSDQYLDFRPRCVQGME